MPEQLRRVDWTEGTWTHTPLRAASKDGDLIVEAVEGSDAWRVTSYGFVHASEHALLAPLTGDAAMEVVFVADFAGQFDQAGIFLQESAANWIKAGLEFADGSLNVGAVVTNPFSDWSIAPVDEWAGQRVRVRLSRSGDAISIRAGVDRQALRLVRVAPFPVAARVVAGPFVCAPTRAGLRVRFGEWSVGPADASLH